MDVSVIQLCLANAFTTLAHALAAEASDCGDERNALLLSRMAAAHQKAARQLNEEQKDWNTKAEAAFPA